MQRKMKDYQKEFLNFISSMAWPCFAEVIPFDSGNAIYFAIMCVWQLINPAGYSRCIFFHGALSGNIYLFLIAIFLRLVARVNQLQHVSKIIFLSCFHYGQMTYADPFKAVKK